MFTKPNSKIKHISIDDLKHFKEFIVIELEVQQNQHSSTNNWSHMTKSNFKITSPNSLFLVLLLLLNACAFSSKRTLQLYEQAKEKGPYDAIIVPGVPHDGVAWSPTMNIRVSWANFLYKNGITSSIIYSGGAVYTQFTEAKIMGEYGKAQGIPASAIYLDTNAEHSSENVYYSYLIAKQQGFKKIALATDPFQSKTLAGMIKKLELPIDLIPINFDTLRSMNRPEPSINPQVTVSTSFVSIKERESFFTRFKGTMGKQIMFHEEDLPKKKLRKYKRQGRVIETKK